MTSVLEQHWFRTAAIWWFQTREFVQRQLKYFMRRNLLYRNDSAEYDIFYYYLYMFLEIWWLNVS